MPQKVFFSFLALLLFTSLPEAKASPQTAWIVLIAGAGSSGDQAYPSFFKNRYFGGYEDAFKKDGFQYIVCPKTHDKDARTIEEREEECVEQISALPTFGEMGKRDIVILGHSTGGLIARELAQDPRVRDRIRSILLFSTPNKGSVFADYVLDQEAKGHTPSAIMATLAEWTSKKKHYLPQLRSDRSGYPSSTFISQDMVDNDQVTYSSVSTSFQNNFTYLEFTRLLISLELGKYGLANTPYGKQNDGVVPLYSQVYGNYLGNLKISHVEGPCPDLTKFGSACKKSKAFVLPVLEGEASK